MQNVALQFDTEHCVFDVRLLVAALQVRGMKTVLVAASDAALLQWKKLVLERAGYRVIATTSIEQLSRTCRRRKIDLVLLGSSLSPAEKRKFWREARSNCRSPVLEIHGTGAPELMDESHAHVHAPLMASDFVEAVRVILDRQ